jgi:signal peptidase I
MNKPRKWWLAGLLSLIRPGLGQMYNGQMNKAIVIILLEYCYIALLYSVAFYRLSAVTIIALVVIGVACFIIVLADSIVVAKRNSTDYALKKYNNIYIYIVVVAVLGTINYFNSEYVKNNVIESFKFSSGSMTPTILIGDHVIVDSSQSAHNPQRGDIVVFEYPKDPEKNFLKRVVAIGGDSVELRNAILYVNGSAVSEPYIKQPEITDSIPRSVSGSNYGPAVVPDNSYFVLGDNRDNSQDSRYFGFISSDKIKGTVRNIYWSWDRSNHAVRWDRIGMQIR